VLVDYFPMAGLLTAPRGTPPSRWPSKVSPPACRTSDSRVL